MSGRRSRAYLLAILMAILAVTFADRSVLGLLLQDIKVDLQLSDTQLGFLSGIAFAFFYSIMGVPIARWADKGNRVVIISLTAALGSVMVVLCGVTMSFVQLLLVRIGVAAGEAGTIPASNSLITDHFDRAERPRAIARFMLGAPLSVVIGFFLAGWLNELYGWRTVFILLGLPGLGLALLSALTLRDPRRGISINNIAGQITDRSQASIWTVFPTLWINSTFRHVLLSYSVFYFFNFGIYKWQPAFFIRSHGMTTVELGVWFGLIYGVGGLLGTYLGGELASRYAPHNERLQLKAMAVLYCSLGIFSACVYLTSNYFSAFGFAAVGIVGATMTNGPLLAIVQAIVPPHMRAISIATVYLFANLFGLGLGPLAAGAMSDAFHPWAGGESLRYALLALCPGYLWGAWHLLQGSSTVDRDVGAVQAHHDRAVRDQRAVTH